MRSVILPAKIEGGQLVIDGERPSDVPVLCLAKADSEGFVVFGDTRAIYLTNTQADVAQVAAFVADLTGMVAELANTAPPQNTPLNPAIKLQAEILKTQIEEYELK